MRISKLTRYVDGIQFVNRRYTKGVPFLSKMVYRRVRGWTLGRSLSVKTFVEYHPRVLSFITDDNIRDPHGLFKDHIHRFEYSSATVTLLNNAVHYGTRYT